MQKIDKEFNSKGMEVNGLSCGVVYSVTGEKFLKEAANSLLSLREQHPEIPAIVLHCGDLYDVEECFENFSNIRFIDLIRDVTEFGLNPSYKIEASRGLKISTFRQSCFDCTLFLDSDTYVKGNLLELFNELSNPETDIIVTNEPEAVHEKNPDSDRPQASVLKKLSCPSYFNSGVYAFRANERTKNFSEVWIKNFLIQARNVEKSEWNRLCDQTAFNQSLRILKNDIKSKIFSNIIWNCQCKIMAEVFNSGQLENTKIIHCKLMNAFKNNISDVLAQPYVKKFSLKDE